MRFGISGAIASAIPQGTTTMMTMTLHTTAPTTVATHGARTSRYPEEPMALRPHEPLRPFLLASRQRGFLRVGTPTGAAADAGTSGGWRSVAPETCSSDVLWARPAWTLALRTAVDGLERKRESANCLRLAQRLGVRGSADTPRELGGVDPPHVLDRDIGWLVRACARMRRWRDPLPGPATVDTVHGRISPNPRDNASARRSWGGLLSFQFAVAWSASTGSVAQKGSAPVRCWTRQEL